MKYSSPSSSVVLGQSLFGADLHCPKVLGWLNPQQTKQMDLKFITQFICGVRSESFLGRLTLSQGTVKFRY